MNVSDESIPLSKRVEIARRASSWVSSHQQETIDLLVRYVDELQGELQVTRDELLDAKETSERYRQRIFVYEQEDPRAEI